MINILLIIFTMMNLNFVNLVNEMMRDRVSESLRGRTTNITHDMMLYDLLLETLDVPGKLLSILLNKMK